MADSNDKQITPEVQEALRKLLGKNNSYQDLIDENGGIIVGGKLVLDSNLKQIRDEINILDSKLKEMVNDYNNMLSDRENIENLKEQIKFAEEYIDVINEENEKIQEKILLSAEEYDKYNKNVDEKIEIEEKLLNLRGRLKKVEKDEDFEKSKKNALEDINKEYNKLLQKKYQERLYNKEITEGLTTQERLYGTIAKHVQNINQVKTGISEFKEGINQIKGAVNSFIDTSMKFLEPWTKLDQATANFAKNIGMSKFGYERLRDEASKFNVENRLSEITGISTEEQVVNMENYISNVGRNVGWSSEMQSGINLASALIGKEQAQAYGQALENFGLSANEAMGRAKELFVSATNSGVAMSKASKLFLDNIKLAQSYTFKNGLDSLAEMAKRAAEIKISFNDVSRFAEKISTLEGSMQAAAGLSVLGGGFAMNANPLQMLYNGLNDFQGVSDMMENMLEGLVKYNTQTKQLEMSAFDRQRLRQAANVMGVNYEALLDEAFAKGREGVAAPAIRALGYGKGSDEYQMLLNRSYLKEGVATVAVSGEEKRVDKLTQSDIEILKENNFDDTENLRTIVSTLRGWDDMFRGTKEGVRARLARDAEVTGIGQSAKNILQYANENTTTLARFYEAYLVGNGIIATTLLGIAASKVFSGLGNMATGKGWTTTGANLTKFSKFGAAGAALGGIAGAGIYQYNSSKLDQGSTSKSNVNWSMGGAALSGAAMGASIGSVWGPGGMAAGAALGAIGGALFGYNNAEKQRMQNVLAQSGVSVRGDYSIDELKTIARGGSAINSSPNLFNKMIGQYGYTREEINSIKPIPGYWKGGFVDGTGTGTSDSNPAMLSKFEYVMPAKEATKPENTKILELMRSGKDLSSEIKPVGDTMKIMKVSDKNIKTEESKTNNIQSTIKVDPINISGTIRLELNGVTKAVDSKELLNNPIFVKNLTDEIAKNLNRQYNYGYDKTSFYKKF